MLVLFEEIGGDPSTARLFQFVPTVECANATENGLPAYVRCPPGTYIRRVDFASYGTPMGWCGNYSVGQCHATDTEKIVEDDCLLHSYCQIPVSDSVFGGDPCPSLTKSLYVQVQCS